MGWALGLFLSCPRVLRVAEGIRVPLAPAAVSTSVITSGSQKETCEHQFTTARG